MTTTTSDNEQPRAERRHANTPYAWGHYSGRSSGIYVNTVEDNPSDYQRVADIRIHDDEEVLQAEANAAFIVTACNAYYEQAERVRELEKAAQVALDWHSDGTPEADMGPAELMVIEALATALNRKEQP